eukprot:CAMPEP_0182475312 /NCGR_PEP_ID=MMETSP1319-20130603/27187_1 /TAXON_ID=172717 /ORGANISM="Bolidomonas pacifica, Strain RCC208" /LENGTH=249 /DNA_ID=CAMNT_0024676297 /DNA_START=159 /DNA_END=905 /DNA_ORIENTATION=-
MPLHLRLHPTQLFLLILLATLPNPSSPSPSFPTSFAFQTDTYLIFGSTCPSPPGSYARRPPPGPASPLWPSASSSFINSDPDTGPSEQGSIFLVPSTLSSVLSPSLRYVCHYPSPPANVTVRSRVVPPPLHALAVHTPSPPVTARVRLALAKSCNRRALATMTTTTAATTAPNDGVPTPRPTPSSSAKAGDKAPAQRRRRLLLQATDVSDVVDAAAAMLRGLGPESSALVGGFEVATDDGHRGACTAGN